MTATCHASFSRSCPLAPRPRTHGRRCTVARHDWRRSPLGCQVRPAPPPWQGVVGQESVRGVEGTYATRGCQAGVPLALSPAPRDGALRPTCHAVPEPRVCLVGAPLQTGGVFSCQGRNRLSHSTTTTKQTRLCGSGRLQHRRNVSFRVSVGRYVACEVGPHGCDGSAFAHNGKILPRCYTYISLSDPPHNGNILPRCALRSAE